jgi:signal transduction histidine kinase
LRPLLLFYLLVIYVLLQFSWWAYLLVELNKEVYDQKIELAGYNDPSIRSGNKASFHRELRERWLMVAGEGVVFIALLIVGIYKTRNAFRKEFALARQQKNFLLSITHEFKSPLAAIKLNLQTLQKRVLERHQQESIITKALNETDRIHTLIENALLAARIESHSFNLQKEEFNLSECIRSLVHNRQIPGVTSRIINLDLDEEVYIKGDPLALSSLLLNLLENAEKYSPENQPVTIELKLDRKNAVISVVDSGTGIPDSEKPKIFEKFYRVGNEETRNTKGTGLGLFIVKHIVNLHHGEIRVSDNKPAGTIFRVTLPLK